MNLLWEYENGTMMTDPDKDHDGINDGAELHYWNIAGFRMKLL